MEDPRLSHLGPVDYFGQEVVDFSTAREHLTGRTLIVLAFYLFLGFVIRTFSVGLERFFQDLLGYNRDRDGVVITWELPWWWMIIIGGLGAFILIGILRYARIPLLIL